MKQVFYEYRAEVESFQQNAIASFINELELANHTHICKFFPRKLSVATCSTCNEISIWVDEEIVYPKQTPVAPPNEDMEQKIQVLYKEASAVLVDSPRSAAALLRLALQLLLKQIGKPGENINKDIQELVSEGLSPKIQKALDLVRVVGNNAVHPG